MIDFRPGRLTIYVVFDVEFESEVQNVQFLHPNQNVRKTMPVKFRTKSHIIPTIITLTGPIRALEMDPMGQRSYRLHWATVIASEWTDPGAAAGHAKVIDALAARRANVESRGAKGSVHLVHP